MYFFLCTSCKVTPILCRSRSPSLHISWLGLQHHQQFPVYWSLCYIDVTYARTMHETLLSLALSECFLSCSSVTYISYRRRFSACSWPYMAAVARAAATLVIGSSSRMKFDRNKSSLSPFGSRQIYSQFDTIPTYLISKQIKQYFVPDAL